MRVAAARGDLGERRSTLRQQCAGAGQAPLHYPRVRAAAEAGFEHAREVVLGETGWVGERGKAEPVVRVPQPRVDALQHAPPCCWRKPAAHRAQRAAVDGVRGKQA